MSGRCCDRNKTIQKACGNLGGKAVRGKDFLLFFFCARIHAIPSKVGIQFKPCRVARAVALTQAFFPTAHVVEFIYKTAYACEIIIDTLIMGNLP